MISTLTDRQIEQVLQAGVIGRLGCHADGKTYVVPVAYAYNEGFIYAHSAEGQKVRMMRQNPSVCFQVDDIDNLANWRSVVIQGEYEELTSRDTQLNAFELLRDRLEPLRTSDAAEPQDPPAGEKRRRPVFYRIRIVEMSGRFEKK